MKTLHTRSDTLCTLLTSTLSSNDAKATCAGAPKSDYCPSQRPIWMSVALILTLQIVLHIQGATVAHADRRAEVALDQCIRSEARTRTLVADYRRETRACGVVSLLNGTLELSKPGLALMHLKGAAPSDEVVYYINALNFVNYSPFRKEYLSQAADDSHGHIQSAGCLEAACFFDPELLRAYRRQSYRIHLATTITVGDQKCTHLVMTGAPGFASYHLYIGQDWLLRGVVVEIGNGLVIESRITRLHANGAIPRAALTWKPPAGSRPSTGSICRFTLSNRLQDPGLTAVGHSAPNFPVTAAGPEIRGISDILRKNRFLVLSFWGFG